MTYANDPFRDYFILLDALEIEKRLKRLSLEGVSIPAEVSGWIQELLERAANGANKEKWGVVP